MGDQRATATPLAPRTDSHEPDSHGAAWAAAGLYLLFVAMSLLQSPGSTTYDTRAELTQRPAEFLAGAFTLWHPETNFGEFQNQAYGYLFPQGAFFVLTDWLGGVVGLPDWVGQRLWSALVLVVAVEGARRVAGAIGLAPSFALVAGVVYGFAPRFLGTVSVISGETLPGAVMPWVVLPVVLALAGRLTPWRAALLSGAAVVCMGGVNAVENAGSLPLAAILVGWGVWRRRVSWRFAAGWTGAVAVASTWWALPLLVLAGYAPPFYEYVESAGDTTALVGWSEATRGSSHWVAYLIVGDQQWWPAANDLVSEPYLVLVSSVVAAVGLVGLALMRHALRGPLVLAVLVGLGALTIAHGGWEGSPVAAQVRTLLDGPLQIFRNVHKIDPTARLPLAIGFAHAVALLVRGAAQQRPALTSSTPLAVMAVLGLVLSLGQPYLANNSRTPGWDQVSDPWQQARDYLAEHQDGRTTLVLPGTGFAEQTWGWTLDEPLLVLGGADFVTRSQVPIVPGQSIRFLTALDQLTATGRASNRLGEQLARAGIGHVVVRRDLDRRTAGSPHPAGASVSMTTAGLESVAAFGPGREGGPEVEVYEVTSGAAPGPGVRLTPVEDVLTVRGGPESILALQQDGVVDETRATVLEGEPGWDRPADVVTDDDQRRERAFGSGDEALSAVLGAGDDWRIERAVHDYPTVPGAPQVTARYDGLRSLTASSSQAYADNYGPVVLQEAPYFAVDGDRDTRWVTTSTTDPREQWLRLVLDEPRPVREVEVTPVSDDPQVLPIRSVEVRAGDQTRTIATNPSGAPVTAEFDGSVVDVVEVRVRDVGTAGDRGRIGFREVTVDGLVATRTLAVPGDVGSGSAWVFGTVAERRACVAATQGDLPDGLPDCNVARIRGNEEPEGLDRTFTTSAPGTWTLRGEAIARATSETGRLLEPGGRRQVGATSVYGSDPRVASRFVYDGSPTTGWVSADQDRTPTVLVRLARERTVTGLRVDPGPEAPDAAVVRSGDQEREVDLTSIAGEVRFAPLRGRDFDIEFVKALGTPRVAVRELGLRGVRLPRRLDTATPTGALCGLGPNVLVDGQSLRTRVVGTLADVVQGSPMTVETCETLDLDAGEHRLTVPPTEEFQVVTLAGTPTDGADGADAFGSPPGATRDLDVTRWSASERTVEVGGGAETLLHLPENFNAGWVAEVDGVELQALRVDGWQQAWVLPEGGEVTVRLTHRPQGVYAVLLPLGLGLSGALLLAGAVIGLLALRRRPSRRDAAWPERHASRVPAWGWPVLVGVGLLLLGPVVALGLVVAVVASRRGQVVAVALTAGALVVASAGIDVLGGAFWWLAFGDAAAAVAVGLLCGAALRQLPPGRLEVVS